MPPSILAIVTPTSYIVGDSVLVGVELENRRVERERLRDNQFLVSASCKFQVNNNTDRVAGWWLFHVGVCGENPLMLADGFHLKSPIGHKRSRRCVERSSCICDSGQTVPIPQCARSLNFVRL